MTNEVELIGIAAVARNGVIGSGPDIPWHIPEDWRRFKRLTLGHPLVMGRKTYDAIGRPLPGRTTVVVTRDRRWRGDGVRACPSVEDALDVAATLDAVVYVAGGGEVYRAAWERLTALEITEVEQVPTGDVTFPAIRPGEWVEVGREPHEGYHFVSYRRRRPRVVPARPRLGVDTRS